MLKSLFLFKKSFILYKDKKISGVFFALPIYRHRNHRFKS